VQKMTEPYETPQSLPDASEAADPLRRRRSFWFRAIWVSVIGVIVLPMIGLVGTGFGITKAFGDLSVKESGISDPKALSGHISTVLVYTAAGLVVSVSAFIVLVGVLIRFFTLPKVPPHLLNSKHNKS
jgi:ABC-type Fe3+ transport system permease subunit